MKIWDIGGQFQYRQNWIDYAKMANVILYMVDSSNVNYFINIKQYDNLSITKRELYTLLEDKDIENTPLLILSNKIDIEPHMSEAEIIKELNLDYVYSNPWAVISISALKGQHFEKVIEWLNGKAEKK